VGVQELLRDHPNHALVDSTCLSLREGFWPFAHINPADPTTLDSSDCLLSDEAMTFIHNQRDLEIAENRYSLSFGQDLLPGMYSLPISAVPKLHSMNLCLINDHSASPHSLNSWINKSDGTIRLDNLQDLGTSLCGACTCNGSPPHWLFKSDVSVAYHRLPMHPLWQLKQVVTIDGQQHIDRCMVFRSRSSPHIWCTFMGLVTWIGIHVYLIKDLLHYMDDCVSFDTNPMLEYYIPYDAYYC